ATVYHIITPRIGLAIFLVIPRRPPSPTLFPYTTLFRSLRAVGNAPRRVEHAEHHRNAALARERGKMRSAAAELGDHARHLRQHRSEEHTSELQSPYDLVCRLLLEKKKQATERENTQHSL